MQTPQETEPSRHDMAQKIDRLNFYRSEIKHEFSLLSDRVSSYVTSQSFLTIAYASAMNNANPRWGSTFTLAFPMALSLLGIVTSLRAREGIAAAADTITLWHAKQNKLFENDPAMEDYRVQRPAPKHRARPTARADSPSQDDIHRDNSPVDHVHQRSLAFARLAPGAFLIAWCAFGTLTIWLHFFS